MTTNAAQWWNKEYWPSNNSWPLQELLADYKLEALQQLQGAQIYFHCFNNVSEHRWHAPGFLCCYVNWSSNLFWIPFRITLVSHIFHNVVQFAILFHYVNNSSIFTNSVPTSNAIHLTSASLFPFWFHPIAPKTNIHSRVIAGETAFSPNNCAMRVISFERKRWLAIYDDRPAIWS